MNKLAVFFPGIRYGTDKPLLYFANLKYEQMGFDSITMDYERWQNTELSMEEKIEKVKKSVWEQILKHDFSPYEELYFCSKSIGTVAAGWTEKKLKETGLLGELSNHITQIYLTPLTQTLPYISHNNDIKLVVSGTNDQYIDADVLKEHCKQENIRLLQIDNVGHRMEDAKDVMRSIDVLKQVIEEI